jgi:uncharacterized membrane protein YhaH (DUF805 family)
MAWTPNDDDFARSERRDAVQKHIVATLFSFRGRINRAPFWLLTATATMILLIITILLPAETFLLIFFLLIGVYLWMMLALLAKRLHDRNRTGWLLLGTFIPLVGVIFFLWLLVEAILPGTAGANRFGTDPLNDPTQRAFTFSFLRSAQPFSAGPSTGTIFWRLMARIRNTTEANRLRRSEYPQPIELGDGFFKEIGETFVVLTIVGVVVCGYFLSKNWAEAHHRPLNSPGDYLDAAKNAIQDKEYVRDLFTGIAAQISKLVANTAPNGPAARSAPSSPPAPSAAPVAPSRTAANSSDIKILVCAEQKHPEYRAKIVLDFSARVVVSQQSGVIDHGSNMPFKMNDKIITWVDTANGGVYVVDKDTAEMCVKMGDITFGCWDCEVATKKIP